MVTQLGVVGGGLEGGEGGFCGVDVVGVMVLK